MRDEKGSAHELLQESHSASSSCFYSLNMFSDFERRLCAVSRDVTDVFNDRQTKININITFAE